MGRNHVRFIASFQYCGRDSIPHQRVEDGVRREFPEKSWVCKRTSKVEIAVSLGWRFVCRQRRKVGLYSGHNLDLSLIANDFLQSVDEPDDRGVRLWHRAMSGLTAGFELDPTGSFFGYSNVIGALLVVHANPTAFRQEKLGISN